MSDLSTILDYRFVDQSLLREALTHGSFRSGLEKNYERLEFLGDRVLGLVIADLLLIKFPDEQAGGIAKRYNELVRAETLIEVAKEIELADYILMKDKVGGSVPDRQLSDACEALIGALYYDGGLTTARQFITKHWMQRLEAMLLPPMDPKTVLQEWTQSRGLELPCYVLLRRKGPDHEPWFIVSVRVGEFEPIEGEGSTKRAAEKLAAERLIIRLGCL